MGPPCSLRIPRVRRYSGYRAAASCFAYRTITVSGRPSHVVQLHSTVIFAVRTPEILLLPVWPLPLSLATTRGISVDFFSSPYLDVSVREVPPVRLLIHRTVRGSSPRGFPHSEICGCNAYLQLTAAYRSLSRPSSAPDAKAFSLCSS